MQFFLVKCAGSLRNLSANLRYPGCDISFFAAAVYDGGHFLADTYLAGSTQISYGSAVQFTAQLFADNRSTGKDGNILQHSLAAVTKARSLNGYGLKGATQLVHYQGSQSFTFHIFGNDQQFTAGLDNFLQHGHDVLDHINLAVRNQDVRIAQNGFHLLSISSHIRGDIATVELHAFHSFQAGLHGLGFFYGDNAVVANFFHGVCDQAADFFIASTDGCNLSLSFLGHNLLGNLLQAAYQCIYGSLDAFLHNHGVSAGSHVLHAFMNHGLS